VSENRLQVAIHDLNQQGGQDRSTLEILIRLRKKIPLTIHAFSVSEPALLSSSRLVRPNIRRPVLLKAIYFYLRLFLRGGGLWHATGVSHLRSRVVHLQFIHKAWRAKRTQRENSGFLRGLYQEFFELFNIALENLCFREGKTYIAISDSVARDLREQFGIEKNIHVVRHGVDPNLFRPLSGNEKANSPVRTRLGIGPGEKMALFVGSYERKGLETLVRALALLSPEIRKDFKLVAVGDGNQAYYSQLAESLGVQKHLLLVSKEKNIVPYFQAADLFVFPTLYEPFGLVILEAMACGLPAIVSRAAGGAELIREGESGLLIENPRDEKEVARKISSTLQSPGKLSEMAKSARSVAEARSWDRVAEEYEAVLTTLVSRPGH
jgi:glycosyltransferase involved in cell wall biosynthesis